MPPLVVYACPRCRIARVVEAGRKSASCGSCGRTLDLTSLRAMASAATLEDAQVAAGAINAKLAGRTDEFAAALVPAVPARIQHDDRFDAAAAATRRATSEKDRVDALARSLRAFSREELREGFARAGLGEARIEDHLKRMLETSVVYQPRAESYVAL